MSDFALENPLVDYLLCLCASLHRLEEVVQTLCLKSVDETLDERLVLWA
ncbi:MAG: hypothetical protein HDR53_02960 [Treponema sp.]|nr:hypothetical protein [Treponema sp.]